MSISRAPIVVCSTVLMAIGFGPGAVVHCQQDSIAGYPHLAYGDSVLVETIGSTSPQGGLIGMLDGCTAVMVPYGGGFRVLAWDSVSTLQIIEPSRSSAGAYPMLSEMANRYVPLDYVRTEVKKCISRPRRSGKDRSSPSQSS